LLSIFKYQRFWYNSYGNFKQISSNQILNNLFDNVFKLIFGLLNINFGLIVGGICGRFVIIFFIFVKILKKLSKNFKLNNLKKKISLLRKYKYFPIHIMPGGLINILSFDIPIIFISFYFGNTYLGFFSLAHRIITLPTILLAKSVGDVYRKLIFDFKIKKIKILPVFKTFLKNNILFSIIFCITIYFSIEEIVKIIFGQNWLLAGQYSQILIFYAFFQFVATPLDKGAIILNHTNYYVNWTLFRLLLQIILVSFAVFYNVEINKFLWGLVFCNALAYIVDLFYQYSFILKHDQNIKDKS
jgi:O-antigen/teichoic acid export membrane protein